MTQKERVLQRIKEVGYIDNVWCFTNRILRLGAIIFDLKEDGMDFRTEMPPDKNCHYYPIYKSRITLPPAFLPKEKVENKLF
jgi:hypothetical protein